MCACYWFFGPTGWACFFLGGLHSITVSINRLTEADTLKQPPRLIVINRGVYFKMFASVNRLTEAFFCNRLCK